MIGLDEAAEKISEAESAMFMHDFFKVANEAKPTLDLVSPKAPILKIVGKKIKAIPKKNLSAEDLERSDCLEFFASNMDMCTKVDAFNQHSLFDMKILAGVLRFCINSVDFDDMDGSVKVVSAVNKSSDSYQV